MTIKYLGLKDLDDEEVVIVKQIVERGYEKLQSQNLKLGDVELTANLKKRNDEGRAKVYEVFLKLSFKNKSRSFDVRNEEWDLKKTLHGAFSALTTYVEHSLREK